jgi:transcriptional regulator with XRE-family HTH domain
MRELRKIRGLSQRELSRRIRLHPLSVRRWESKGRRLPYWHVSTLAAALQVPPAVLVGTQPLILEDQFIYRLVKILHAAPPPARAEIVKRLILLAGLTGCVEASASAFSFEPRCAA